MNLEDLKIRTVTLATNQYYQNKYPKNQIYIHHTAGNADAEATFGSWGRNEAHIATCVAISGKSDKPRVTDGQIIQGFSSKHWAYHLGIKQAIFKRAGVPYKSLDKYSIGIEICNFGYLKKDDDGNFRTYVDSIIPKEEVVTLDKPYKGYKHWHAYTDAQIESVRKLLLYWSKAYDIPLTYNDDIWEVTERALKGESGVFTHNSVRVDKTDISPQPKMIAMLKSLTGKAPAKKATPAKKESVAKKETVKEVAKAAPKAAAKKAVAKKAPVKKAAKKSKK